MISSIILLLQIAGTTSGAGGISAPALCLTRTVVDSEGKSQPYLVVVKPSDATELLAANFQATECSAAHVDPEKYREIVCRVAAAPNDAVQNRYAALFGVRAKTLCDTATALGSGLATILKGGK